MGLDREVAVIYHKNMKSKIVLRNMKSIPQSKQELSALKDLRGFVKEELHLLSKKNLSVPILFFQL